MKVNEFGIVQNKDWTCGLVDPWTRGLCFFNFTKMRKKHRKTGNEFDFRIIFFVLCTMPHCRALPPERKKGFIIYSVCSVLFIRRDGIVQNKDWTRGPVDPWTVLF